MTATRGRVVYGWGGSGRQIVTRSVNSSYLVHAYLMRRDTPSQPRRGGAFATFLHQPEIRKWRDEFVGEIRNLAARRGPADRPQLFALNCFGKASFYSYVDFRLSGSFATISGSLSSHLFLYMMMPTRKRVELC